MYRAAYFISDIHLGLGPRMEEKAKEERLLSFLQYILPFAEMLVIVGDLFDFWFEYKTVIPKGFHRTLAALQEFTDRNIPVHYLVGNHDFWVGDFFETELGMILHSEPFEMSVGGKRVFLHHGDGLANNDRGYLMLKPILRNKFNIRLYRWLHPDLGVPLARGSSRGSRAHTARRHQGKDLGIVEFAHQKIAEGVDVVVMGHQHRPSIAQIKNGLYVNLGDWITFNTYGEMRNGVMRLNTWEEKTRDGR